LDLENRYKNGSFLVSIFKGQRIDSEEKIKIKGGRARVELGQGDDLREKYIFNE
jgi:hypothetical protein